MIKLAVPCVGKEELDEIKKVLDSKYLVQGDKVIEFENLVSEYLNVKHAIAVSSGTAALHLALVALDIKFGDQVIVPDFTFPATANVVELNSAESIFVDIKLDSFCIDVDKIEENITEKSKVIIPVHEFGQSAEMDKIMKLAKKNNLKVIEDAACAFGAEYKGKKVGTIGDIGCFSFHPRKAITTGEGGMIVTNSDELAEKIKVFRNHGIVYRDGKVQFVNAGFNYRMTNIQGAMGMVQMNKIERINRRRREIALKYNELLKEIRGISLPLEKNNARYIWQTYHILLDKSINRDFVIKRLKERGIETNIGAYAVHEQPYYKEKYCHQDCYFTNSIVANRCGLALPLHLELKNKDLRYIAFELEEIINEYNS